MVAVGIEMAVGIVKIRIKYAVVYISAFIMLDTMFIDVKGAGGVIELGYP